MRALARQQDAEPEAGRQIADESRPGRMSRVDEEGSRVQGAEAPATGYQLRAIQATEAPEQAEPAGPRTAPKPRQLKVMELNSEFWNGLAIGKDPNVKKSGYGYINVERTCSIINSQDPDIILLEDMNHSYWRQGNTKGSAGFSRHLARHYNVTWREEVGIMVRKPGRFLGPSKLLKDNAENLDPRSDPKNKKPNEARHLFAHAEIRGRKYLLGAGHFMSHGNNAIARAARKRRDKAIAAARARWIASKRAADQRHAVQSRSKDPTVRARAKENHRTAVVTAYRTFSAARERAESRYREIARDNPITQRQHTRAANTVMNHIKSARRKDEEVLYGADFNELQHANPANDESGYRTMRARAGGVFGDTADARSWRRPAGSHGIVRKPGKPARTTAGTLGVFSTIPVKDRPSLARHTGPHGTRVPTGRNGRPVREEHLTQTATFDEPPKPARK